MLPFSHRLAVRAQEVGGWLCVGLDPQLERLPLSVARTPEGIVQFCQAIIAATSPFAVAFKINFAFFEALGSQGWRALANVRDSIPANIPAIADAKRGDIGTTSSAYAQAIFSGLAFDAVTVSPYLGWDALQPFFDYEEKCSFVLCRTSNPGAGAIQELTVCGEPLYLLLARDALNQGGKGEIGLVVGGTQPTALASVRGLSQDVLLLVPGIGAQGASAEESVRLGANRDKANAIINVSRDILYASGGENFADVAGETAQRFLSQLAS